MPNPTQLDLLGEDIKRSTFRLKTQNGQNVEMLKPIAAHMKKISRLLIGFHNTAMSDRDQVKTLELGKTFLTLCAQLPLIEEKLKTKSDEELEKLGGGGFDSFVELFFDCSNAMYIYLDIEILSDMANQYVDLLLKWPGSQQQHEHLLKTLVHNLMPIYMYKTTLIQNDEYLTILIDCSITSLILSIMEAVWIHETISEMYLTRLLEGIMSQRPKVWKYLFELLAFSTPKVRDNLINLPMFAA